MKFKQLENKYQDTRKPALIICPGPSTKIYERALWRYICEQDPITFSINNVPALLANLSHYHLWTNNARFARYGSTIANTPATILLGHYIKKIFIQNSGVKNYIQVSYTDRDTKEPYSYKDGIIHGYYRSSACLAIAIAHIMGLKRIYIAGMDGFVSKIDGSNHSYEEAPEDKKSDEEWEQYDKIICKVLKRIFENICRFSIITPTIHKDFYEEGVI
jgi:hypothetical protein